VRLAIFGFPVRHSLSPAMHRAALRRVGIEGDYVTREVDRDGFLAGVADLRDGALDGANVTMPHKMAAFAVCDEVTHQAHRVGAVNTLYVVDDVLKGENTDVLGVRTAWTSRQLPDEGPVIILGAGGASAAAQVALAGREQYVVARRPDLAAAVVGRIGSDAVVIEWGQPTPRGVVVNATSIGMHGEILPEFLLDSATGLFDMPYGDKPTRSVDAARMLVGQAVGSFNVWTGIEVDSSVFRRAAEEELKRRTR
jgi:shikimate dehydrogenase